MSRSWKRGEIGVHPVYGYRSIFVPQCSQHNRDCWHNESGMSDPGSDERIPLVVIDPEDHEQIDALCDAIAASSAATFPNRLQEALRSLVAEPEPEEPTLLGAVVLDGEGADWHRTRDGRWIASDGLRSRGGGWGHIPRPLTILSPGWEPES